MRLRARGFLLFSFAFSSVLASSAVLETPSRTQNGKTTLESGDHPERRSAEGKSVGLKTANAGHGLEKRSPGLFPQNFGGEENKKKEPVDSLREDLEKRTRVGFNGMRGKKEFTADDYCAKNLRANLERALIMNKRFSRGFGELLGGKRATMAFHGMRGKKSDDYDNEIQDDDGEFREPFLNQEFLIDSGLFDDPEEMKPETEEEEMRKRSPYSFQGMRGKKESAYDLKRAMGFLGMRGKKATEVWDSEANYKRVPQTSFFGMKGKKAQSSGFFGMRGKKASPSAFFGIKGKREPMGYDLQDFSLFNQLKEPEPRNRFRRGVTWLNNSKKAKNAFFGIRGKKSTQGRLESTFSNFYE